MGKAVLIGYESKTGTTKEVCEILTGYLVKDGYDVHLTTMSEIKDMTPYDHIVLASPINRMSWMEAPKNFLIENEAVLKEKEVGLIYVAYMLNVARPMWRNAMLKNMQKIGAPILPSFIHGFGGKVTEPIGAIPRFIFGISKDTSMDLRDEDEVRKFAMELHRRWSELHE